MKIIVFSDSHMDVEAMSDVVKKTNPDMIIHLGDHINDAIKLEQQFINIPIEYVRGNCDSYDIGPVQKLLNIENKKLFITHGDRYGVHSGTSEILNEGLNMEADLVLFGHTHHPVVKLKKGIILMNPGRIGRFARGHWPPSFGIVDIEKEINCCTLEYEFAMKNNIY